MPKAKAKPEPGRMERFHEGRVEHLRMFMPVSEIIDTVHKVDSPHAPSGGSDVWSPKDQWSKPADSGYSLKDVKLAAAKSRVVGTFAPEGGRQPGKALMPEVAGGRSKPLGIYSRPGKDMTLADGHHRLALHEHLGHQFAAVEYRNKPQWGDLPKTYKNDRS